MRQRHQNWMGYFLCIILLLSNFFAWVPNQVSAADDVRTVAEAIADNSGSGTVEGYIVGHATGSKAANFNAPFGNDYNFLIADSPDEQNLDSLLDVQISGGYRSEFGLQANPDLIGKKVRVTGSFAAYNNFPGLKSPTGIELVFEETDPDVISVSEARALNDGDSVVVRGVATTASGTYGSKGFYIQDDTAGIYIQQSSDDISAGDEVKVTGVRSAQGNEVVIEAVSVEITGTGTVPAPVQLTPASVTENVYGQLVKLSGVTVSDITYGDVEGSYSFYANDGDGRIRIYVDYRTGLTEDAVSEGLAVNVTGVVAPYNDDSLQIKPTGVNDIVTALAGGAGKKVLFDNTHGQTAGAADWVIDGGFSDFAEGLRAEGFTVDALEREMPYDFSDAAITLDKLQQYDVFVLPEANIPMKSAEQDAMLQYVQGGGSIFFIADHYNADRNLNRWDATEVFNGYRRGAFEDPAKGMSAEEAASPAMDGVTSSDWLGQNFGIRFRYNALGDIESGQTVVAPNDSFGITEGVTTVESHAGGTLAILDPLKAKGLVYMPEDPPAWGNAVDQGVYNGGGIDEGPFAAISKVGLGKAAFIGDSSPVEDATPKYLREDSGSTKTTYDGFTGEGQNSTFLIQTVKWLAVQEDYTSFDGLIELSEPTPLLPFEEPAATTEPQPEPWSNPSAGYKWYDPTTFAPGSYGSSEEPPAQVVIPGVISIAEARQYTSNTTLTVEGIITSNPGDWGGQGFYLQDETGGIYIYQDTQGYQPGQRVKVTGDATLYNGELELTNTTIEVTGTGTLPEPRVVTAIGDDNQGQVVRLEGVTIKNIVKVNTYGTIELDAMNGDVSTRVRIDNRTGVTYDTFTAQYAEGDTLDITGISSVFNGTYQLKPRGASDIALANADSDLVNVDLIGLNDLHGKIDQHYELDIDGDGVIDGTYGGAEYMAAYVREKQEANPNTLFVGVGDLIGGSSPVSAMFQDEPTVEIMNSLNMAVNVVGNHEFDEGTTELMRMVNGGDYPGDDVTRDYAGMDNAELAANVVWRSGEQQGESILPAYEIKEVEGEKIGFIGVVTEGAADMVMPTGIQDIEFTDPVAAINDAVEELQAQGVHAIVVLAHSPAEQAENGTITGEAANYVGQIDPDVDVIFAAHNHVVVNGMVGDNDTLIVQASEYGKALSDVQLKIDPSTGDITGKSADIIWVDNNAIEPDPEVSGILDHYEEQVAPLLNEVVGEAAHAMEGGYGVKGEIGDNALGNLIADSMVYAMDSDFAMMNGGGIRDNLDAGDISYGELFNILPFNNVLTKLEITGSELKEIVNGQLTTYYGPDFSISGFKYTWDGSTAKVVDITFPDGTPIDPDQTYTLTVNNFMATSTGDKYKAIGQLGENMVMGPEDLEGLVSFVKSFDGPIDYVAEGRISEVAGSGPEFGETVSIAEAKLLADDTEVTVEGVVTSEPGEFGASNSFYLEDATGAIQVYTYDDPGVSIGDQLKLKSVKDTYNGVFELNGIAAFEIQGKAELTPQTVTELGQTVEYELVKLQNVTIANISGTDSYGNFSFDAVNGDHSTKIYVDSRTGISYDAFASKYAEGNVLNITGIAAPYNGGYQLKPRMMEDFASSNAEEPANDFTVGQAQFTNFAGDAVTALTPNGFIKTDVEMTNQSGEDKSASLIVALYDANGSVRNLSYVEKLIGAGETETLNAGFNLPDNVQGYTLKAFVWDSLGGMQPLSGAVVFPE